MSYATQDMLVKRVGERTLVQLTDRAEVPTGTIDNALVEQELAAADATINSYVVGRYRLPFATVPVQIAGWALDITLYKLHVFAPDQKIRDDYNDAIRALEKVADGKITLEAEGVAPPSSGASGVQFIDRERPLSPESMQGFI